MKQMQGIDAAFVAMEHLRSPMHIGSLHIYDPSTARDQFVRFKDILAFIERRLPLAQTMRQRIVQVPLAIDYPYWINDPDFDLEYHVRHIALPKPGNWRQLNILAARIFSRPLDLSCPPWELTVIEGLDNVDGVPPGSFATLIKVHHSAIDGVSGIDLQNALHSLTPDVGIDDLADEWEPETVPNSLQLFIRGQFNAITQPCSNDSLRFAGCYRGQ